jgi:hypothetical protein
VSDEVLHAALALAELGIGTIPVHDKRPALESWAEYQERLPRRDELEEHHKNGHDLAAIQGRVSGGLETVDIEDPALLVSLTEKVRELAGQELLDKLVMARTPGGGEHWYYRHCGAPEPRQVLARDRYGDIAIETRAEGCFAVIPPSAGRTYIQGTLLQVQTISKAERCCLLQAARTLHVEPPDPIHTRDRIIQGILRDQDMTLALRAFLVARLFDLSCETWTDLTAEAISATDHIGLRQAKERLRTLVSLGIIKEKSVYQTTEQGEPRVRHLRMLDRHRIQTRFLQQPSAPPSTQRSSLAQGGFYDRFRQLVSIRQLLTASHVKVSRLNKFMAFWRGEQHASVHLHPPDARCPYEHACDYGDNNRHLDAFDLYCLLRGFARWDGTLHINKSAGIRAALADYPELRNGMTQCQGRSSRKERLIIDGWREGEAAADPARDRRRHRQAGSGTKGTASKRERRRKRTRAARGHGAATKLGDSDAER